MRKNNGSQLRLKNVRFAGYVIIAKLLEMSLRYIADQLYGFAIRILGQQRMSGCTVSPRYRCAKVTRQLLGLRPEAQTIEKGKVGVLTGVSQKRDDICERAFSASLVSDHRD